MQSTGERTAVRKSPKPNRTQFGTWGERVHALVLGIMFIPVLNLIATESVDHAVLDHPS